MPDGDPITLEAVRFFARPEGRALLDQAAAPAQTEWGLQEKLRQMFPAAMCRAAAALVALRAAARGKLAHAASMFFDRTGLEMASRTEIARHRASRLAGHGSVADLCCGIGGDLVELARLAPVFGIDIDARRVGMARLNCEALQVAPRGLAVADVTTLRPGTEVVYIDPARRDTAGRHGRHGAAYTPPLAFAAALRQRVPRVAIKLSPAIAEAELPAGWEAEFLSSGGQCRECTLYSDFLASGRRRATVLPGGDSLAAAPGAPAPTAPPGDFLYDPDPAVVRAHLIDELARLLDAWKLDPQVAYLSAAAHAPTPFARGFRVLAVRRFQPGNLRRHLQAQGLRPVEIMMRRFPLRPEAVRRQLGTWQKGTAVTLVLTRLAEGLTCLICTEVARTRLLRMI